MINYEEEGEEEEQKEEGRGPTLTSKKLNCTVSVEWDESPPLQATGSNTPYCASSKHVN